jgi:hypothetical protein
MHTTKYMTTWISDNNNTLIEWSFKTFEDAYNHYCKYIIGQDYPIITIHWTHKEKEWLTYKYIDRIVFDQYGDIIEHTKLTLKPLKVM